MAALIVNSPDPMVKARVMVTKDLSDAALKVLQDIGVLHVEESEDLQPVDREVLEQERRKVSELLAIVSDVLSCIPDGEEVDIHESIGTVYVRPFEEIDREIRPLCNKLRNMYAHVAGMKNRLEELAELSRCLKVFEPHGEIKLRDLTFTGGYLFSRVFMLPLESCELLCQRMKDSFFSSATVVLGDEAFLYVMARTELQVEIETAVREGGGRVLHIPDEDILLTEFLSRAADEMRGMEKEVERLQTELEGITRENLEQLALFKMVLSAESERLSVLEKASEAKYVRLIEGWVPEACVEEMISTLKEDVKYIFIETKKPEEEEQPPSKYRNSALVRPFQLIISLFGTPKYKEWDPTPIVAYSFALFFGIMLADVVYSALIMLFAYKGLRMFVDDPKSDGVKLFQRVLYIGGGVGLVIGVLSGSYMGDFSTLFGIESLALVDGVKEALTNPMTFIVMSLVIGLIHINIAHILALIKGIRCKKREVAIGKAGLFILQIAGIPLIMNSILHVEIPFLNAQAYSVLLYAVGLGVVLIIIAAIMEKGVFMGSIFWIFDITGVLGDVMSYCRLAGVSLATYYLALCFNLIASLVSGIGPAGIGQMVIGTLLAVLVLLFGHGLNLVLSGITCFVHSLRLCFVEFLFKFYDGGGGEYSPFRLNKRPVFVKGRS